MYLVFVDCCRVSQNKTFCKIAPTFMLEKNVLAAPAIDLYSILDSEQCVSSGSLSLITYTYLTCHVTCLPYAFAEG